MNTAIQSVTSRRDLGAFIQFPLDHYHGHPHFVPPLTRERRRFFDPQKNPLFAHTEVAYFLARGEGGDVVGRISAHINQRYIDQWDEAAGCFGFFECIPEQEVADALFSTAEAWLRERGMAVVRGPFNFSTNDECGLLVEGFDLDPTLMMPYTHAYYPDLVLAAGYAPAKDLLAYEMTSAKVITDHLVRAGPRLARRAGVTIRPLDMRRFASEVAAVFELYNQTWEANWGFVPMTEDEFEYLARDLKPVINPDLALVAEAKDRAVGFLLALPDVNPLLKHGRGRMGLIGALRFQAGLRRLRDLRVIALGVHPEFQKNGIESLLMGQALRNGLDQGYVRAEMSWILEDNILMTRAMQRLGGVVRKRYRIYKKTL